MHFLKFYESFDVGSCPEEWHWPQCQDVRVNKKVAKSTICDLEDEDHHMKWTYKKVTEWVCEDKESHDNYWETEDKCWPKVKRRSKEILMQWLLRKEIWQVAKRIEKQRKRT